MLTTVGMMNREAENLYFAVEKSKMFRYSKISKWRDGVDSKPQRYHCNAKLDCCRRSYLRP